MKNLNYFPYERNKYFYGKLLSVDDFESEQRYMNDKRRLINRFMHGCGVVCGLGVVPVNDDTISLEAGLALDFAGREIIVEKPVLKRLTEIEGFSGQDSGMDTYQYLCIEYFEYEKDPVYGVAGGSSLGEDVCYNKIAESCHIYLTSQEPECGSEIDRYCEESKIIYWGNGIRISQVFPRYVKSGSEFDFRLVVENMGQKQPISFGYELVFECFSRERKKCMKVLFDERELEKSRHYEIPITLKASDVKWARGTAALRPGSFWLKIGEYMIEEASDAWGDVGERKEPVESVVEITTEDTGRIISQRYFDNAMQEVAGHTYHQSIYLAKIHLVCAGSTVVIEEVECMPFRQYIYSDVLSSIREKAEEEEQKQLRRRLAEMKNNKENVQKTEEVFTDHPTACGIATLDLGIGGLMGQCFYSKPISHGLGLGSVAVVAGIAYGEKESHVCYGAAHIFGEEDLPVRAEVAVKADRTEGTFVIGLKLTEPTSAERVNIHWTAIRSDKEQADGQQARDLFIKPDMVYLSLREDYYFEAVFTGANDNRVTWSVREAVGGSVDENGMYTAPNVPGIYEITAVSEAYPELKASAFAVVRDTDRNT